MNFETMVERNLDVRQRQGDEWLALCPFHDDRSPSFHVNVVKHVYICFSCGASGGARKLAERFKVAQLDLAPGQEQLERTLAELEAEPEDLRVYPEAWLNQFDHDHVYWKRRGFSPTTIDRFRLGYDPMSHSVTIPIRTFKKEVLGVVRRRLDDVRPKYVYPKGLSIARSLYGAWEAQEFHRVAICEGPLDAVAMWDAGIPAVAMYGSRISDAQIRLTRIMGVRSLVIATDNDDAGVTAGNRIVEAFPMLSLQVFRYPEGTTAKDPGELTRAERRAGWDHAEPLHLIRMGA